MNMKVKNRSKKSVSTTILYISVAVVALMGAALLITNVMLYLNAVNQYVAQGYTKAEVIKQLLPMQLLPGIFEPVAVYGGIALALFYIGKINEKVTKALSLFTANKEVDELASENTDAIIIDEDNSSTVDQN